MHQRRGLNELEPVGHANDFAGRPRDAFGVAALLGPLGDETDPVAGREVVNLIPDRPDDTGTIAARNLGKGNGEEFLQVTGTQFAVARSDARRGDIYQHLAIGAFRLGHLGQTQHFGGAELIVQDRFHRSDHSR